VPDRYLFERYGLTFAQLADGSEVVVQRGEARGSGVEILSGLQPGDALQPIGSGR